MYAGKIVEHGTTLDIFANPLHPYTKGLLKSIPRLDQSVERLYTIDGIVPSLGEMPAGCRFCPRCPQATAQCECEEPPLMDAGGRKVRCWLYADKPAKEAAHE